ADEDHRLDPSGLRRGEMEEDDAAAAQADGLEARDVEVIEQRADIECALTEAELAGRIRRRSMAPEIRSDHAVTRRRLLEEDVPPVGAASHRAVQPEKRFPDTGLLPVQLDPVDLENHRPLLTPARIIRGVRRENQSGSAGLIGWRGPPNTDRVHQLTSRVCVDRRCRLALAHRPFPIPWPISHLPPPSTEYQP